MSRFGSQSCAKGTSSQAPTGYEKATVHLGAHRETVSFCVEHWSAQKYVQHWKESAASLLSGQVPTLFCTDYTSTNCSCFVGWRDGDGFVFEEWVINTRDLAQEGLRLIYTGPIDQPYSNASHFHVSAAEVHAFVSKRT